MGDIDIHPVGSSMPTNAQASQYFEKSCAALEAHLSYLSPLVVEDIVNGIQESMNKDFDFSFDTYNLHKDTRKMLDDLNQNIKAYLAASDQATARIRNRLQQIKPAQSSIKDRIDRNQVSGVSRKRSQQSNNKIGNLGTVLSFSVTIVAFVFVAIVCVQWAKDPTRDNDSDNPLLQQDKVEVPKSEDQQNMSSSSLAAEDDTKLSASLAAEDDTKSNLEPQIHQEPPPSREDSFLNNFPKPELTRTQASQYFEKSCAALEAHLSALFNPFVVEDIVNGIQESMNKNFDFSFDNYDLHKDTRNMLDDLNQNIKAYLAASDQATARIRNRLQQIIGFIAHKPAQRPAYWEELNFFLQIPEIKRLSNNPLKRCYEKMVKIKEDPYSKLCELLEDDGVDTADSHFNERIKEAWKRQHPTDLIDVDFRTLVSGMFKKGPTPQNSVEQAQPRGDTLVEILKQANERASKIVDGLEANQQLFREFLDDLLKSELQHVNLTRLHSYKDMQLWLKESFELYEKMEPEEHRSEENILKCIVENVLYKVSVNRPASLAVARIMSLLSVTEEYLQEIRNRSIVIFFGNTGSGKSCTICNLLGLPLEKTVNAIGEAVYKHGRIDDNAPKIGSKIGISETLYAKAYPLQRNGYIIDPALLDTPGLEESRGPDYKTVTSLSIDLSIRAASDIMSLVLVAPLSTFSSDNRGNGAVDLITTAAERFPTILNSTEDRKRVFLLITKVTNPLLLQRVKNGNFADQMILEVQEEMTRQRRESPQLVELEPHQFSVLTKRLQIWKLVKDMANNGRIEGIVIGDNWQREELLSKYLQEDSQQHPRRPLDKSTYRSAMEDPQLEKTFADTLTTYAHTWVHIFSKYLNELPDEITRCNKAIAENNETIARLEKQERDQLNYHNRRVADLQQTADNYRRLAANPKGVNEDELRNITQDANSRTRKRRIKEKSDLESTRNAAKTPLEAKQQEMQQFKKKIKASKQHIQDLENEKQGLEKGTDHVIQLASFNGECFGGKMRLCSISQEERDAAMNQVRELNFENSHCWEVETASYVGPTVQSCYISKDFRLVPATNEARAAFKDDASLTNIGTVEAKMDGTKFKILRRNAADDGKRVVYEIQTEWDGARPLPWYKITHTIASKDFNEAQILNLDDDIKNEKINCTSLEAKLVEINQDSKPLEKSYEEAVNALNVHNEETKRLEAEALEDLKNRLEKLVKTSNAALSAAKKERDVHAAQTPERLQLIQQYRDKLQYGMKELTSLTRNKIEFALMIRSQIHMADTLRMLSDLIIDAGGGTDRFAEKIYNRASAVEVCRKFTQLYDSNISQLEANCTKDLGFPRKK